MLGVEFSPRSSGMSSRPDLQPHPPAVLPVDALAPRPKQPHLYSRVRARPGQTVELSSRTIEAASVASLSATVQSIEGRVANVRALRATSPMTRVLKSQHSPAPPASPASNLTAVPSHTPMQSRFASVQQSVFVK